MKIFDNVVKFGVFLPNKNVVFIWFLEIDVRSRLPSRNLSRIEVSTVEKSCKDFSLIAFELS